MAATVRLPERYHLPRDRAVPHSVGSRSSPEAFRRGDAIQRYSREEAVQALEELFDIETIFVVIDDIDTLTTSSVDAGMEELFLVLSRSKSGSKILYTQRGFPSFAPNAAIEVPGLREAEFDQFLALCCEKFSVESPAINDSDWIKVHSEGRPLAIETMIGMRRITSSYSEAFQRWVDNSSEAREYLFKREYQQLSRDDRGRYLLAALAVFDTAQSFEALRSVLQFSSEQLQDAIAETRDMFLRVSPGKASGDLYSIGAATRLFVSEASRQLDKYATIEARVNHFKLKLGGSPAAYVALMDRAKRALIGGHAIDAVELLTKKEFPPAFKEHPEVQALLGQAYGKLNPPRVVEARQCFESAFALGHRNYKMYIEWLNVEKKNRTEVVNGIEICKKVVADPDFDQRTKATFLGRLARLQALRARDVQMAAPQDAIALRRDSVLNNIRAFAALSAVEGRQSLSARERADNSISIVLRSALGEDDFDSFFDTLNAVFNEKCCIDEFSDTLAGRINEIKTRRPKSWKLILPRLHQMKALLRGGVENLSREKISTIILSLDGMIEYVGAHR